ncbi:MAG: 4-(cytidine 5'-diphospho)-2-C-methyl-D-erythritol kinase [Lachnospiraceae bacterium]|nr:4-(cytidine 5'-diphospho)-2-C-methyl-D-erythritol kinase [Lachnospiraceae bacterium]
MQTVNAYAKINLSLDIVGEREDGYHLLRMVMQTLSLHDEISLSRTEVGAVRILCDDRRVPVNEHNTCFKAAKLLLEEAGIKDGVEIKIKKLIPVAAGLAGGSSDAAAVMKAVNTEFSLGLSAEDLKERAVNIGADVPYCILGGTALSEGIGERLTALKPLEEYEVLLVKPKEGVSTKEVYRAYDETKVADHPDTDALVKEIGETGRLLPGAMENVLESVTIPLIPEIREIKETLKKSGCAKTLMSGSGPTVYAVYENTLIGRARAEDALTLMKRRFSDCKVMLTKTIQI